jgi:hypothetical protein
MGYSSTYVKALKTGSQGGATPLHSIITRVKPIKQRTSRAELIEHSAAMKHGAELSEHFNPELPPAILPKLDNSLTTNNDSLN